ncbi:MAG: YbaK/EbsC family protein [Caldilineaceae bacterium]
MARSSFHPPSARRRRTPCNAHPRTCSTIWTKPASRRNSSTRSATRPPCPPALGVAPDQIVKTLLFLVEHPAWTAAAPSWSSATAKAVDKRPLADYFNVGKKRIKLAPAEVVLELLGYPAGGVPPFGHRTDLPVILDASVVATGGP